VRSVQHEGLDDSVAATVDHVAIDRLQRAYADGVTRRDWGAVASLFLPDATVDLDLVTRPGRQLRGPDEIVGFIGPAVDDFEFFEFAIVNSHNELWPDGDRDAAAGRIFMCELRVRRGERERSDAFGRYEDAYRRTPAGWRIAARRYRSIARFPDGVVFPLA
jgi:ketosteroid isomerase-like protein